MTSSKSTPLQIYSTVVFALFVRELKTRFGKYRLGYLWAILDPMAHVLVISTLFILGFRTSSIAGISPPLLVVTGIIPFFLFRHIVTMSLKAVDANMGLFNYRRVKPFDSVSARILLEIIVSAIVFVLLLLGFALFGYEVEVINPLGVITIFGFLVMLSSGLGLIASIVGPLFPEIRKLIPIAIRPLYFISGVFYAADAIPEPYRKYLLINPLFHVSDLIRANLFSSFTSTSASFTYLAGCSLVSFFFGLAIYRINRFEVITSKNQ